MTEWHRAQFFGKRDCQVVKVVSHHNNHLGLSWLVTGLVLPSLVKRAGRALRRPGQAVLPLLWPDGSFRPGRAVYAGDRPVLLRFCLHAGSG